MEKPKLTTGADEIAAARILWILRIGLAGCFIGHGAFGVITKAAWVPYFGVAGVSESLAWKLMPWVGSMDILMGILVLVRPCRALFIWAALWATWTALLRPFSGEPTWEFIERAGNYGVPFALLVIVGTSGALFARLPGRWPALEVNLSERLARVLQLTTAALLVGHAGLGLFAHKTSLARHYAAVGFPSPTGFVPAIGAFEFFLAALVLLAPRRGLFLFICLWKVSTESLFIISGSPSWEVIERFGSYAAPLALVFLLTQSQPESATSAYRSEPI